MKYTVVMQGSHGGELDTRSANNEVEFKQKFIEMIAEVTLDSGDRFIVHIEE